MSYVQIVFDLESMSYQDLLFFSDYCDARVDTLYDDLQDSTLDAVCIEQAIRHWETWGIRTWEEIRLRQAEWQPTYTKMGDANI